MHKGKFFNSNLNRLIFSEFSKNGIAKAYLDGIGYNYYGQYNDGKVGYINKTGKIIMPFIVFKKSTILKIRVVAYYCILDNKVGLLNQMANCYSCYL